MALAAIHVFQAGEVLTASNLNAMNTNILNNAISLISPLTGSLDAGGFDITAIDELSFTDASAAPSAAGRLRRNGGVLNWASAHNGGFKPGAVSGTPVANAAYQESFVKGWVNANVAGGINDSFNVASITDTGTGVLTVTWDRDFASDAYALVATARHATLIRLAMVTDMAAGTCEITVRDENGTAADPTSYYVLAAGDQ